MIYELDGATYQPQIHATAWVAESASVIGRVVLHEQASVWFQSVLRGDTDWIHIGARSNVQDGSVLHADEGIPLHVASDVTIGHQVMLHGCTIGQGSLIGIGSVILNHACIGQHCLVGARSLITEGKQFPDGVLIMGSPAKVIRDLTPDEIKHLAYSSAHYVANAKRFHQHL